MNYWLTVHWPLYRDEKQDETDEDPAYKNYVFLAEGYQHIGENLTVGDHVLIYETASAPRKKSGRQFIAAEPGRKAIIAHVIVKGVLEPNSNNEDEYEDGRKRCWKFQAKTKLVQECDIKLSKIRRILRYKNRYGVRIPGGLRKIDKTKFDALHIPKTFLIRV